MASVLGRVRVRRLWLGVGATLLAIAIMAPGGAAYDPNAASVTEEEVNGFMWELSSANKSCDAEWYIANMSPGGTLTYVVKGTPPYTTSFARDEYVEEIRKYCRGTLWGPRFDRYDYSVVVGGFGTEVSGEWTDGAKAPFRRSWGFASGDPTSVNWTITLMRERDGRIKMYRYHQTEVPRHP